MAGSHADATVKVWDAGVRLFHWLLVAAVLTAGITGFFGARNALDIHIIAGTAIADLIGFRLLWGVLGGGYARFTTFTFAPRVIVAYAQGVIRGTSRRYLGHNPLGGVMVFALLAVLALIVVTGVITLGGQDKQGPLAAFTPFAAGWAMRSIHKLLALMLVAMVAAHLAGVVYESRHERENLTVAMVTGRKREEPGSVPPTGRSFPWRVAALMLAGSGVIGVGVAVLAARPGLGVPTGALDVDYARECSACHIAYHPSLLPEAAGHTILSQLGHHFGEDASLDPAIIARLSRYMAANAAEHWDTLPAVMFRKTVSATDPLRITASGFWQRMHRNIPDSVFADKRVGGRSSCNACHADAESGLFAPQNIEIPEELQ